MTPTEAIEAANHGQVRPVYLVVGEELVLVDRVVRAIRRAAVQGGVADFNVDVLDAADVKPADVLSVARTAPMMSPRRFVLVRGVEHWEAKESKARGRKSSKARGSSSTDSLAEYVKSPTPSTCLVLSATKLDKRRKLFTAAKKQGYVVSCESLRRWDLPAFIEKEAAQRGHRMQRGVADILAEVAGPDLAPVLDALERLSLYVGEGKPIGEQDVAVCITRVRPSSVWDLVAAVANKDVATALQIVADVHDPRDGGLPLVGALAWSTRQLLTYAAARRAGANQSDAAAQARVPHFNIRRVEAQVRRLSCRELERWLTVLAQADRRLKRSKMKSLAVLEFAILTMTTDVPM